MIYEYRHADGRTKDVEFHPPQCQLMQRLEPEKAVDRIPEQITDEDGEVWERHYGVPSIAISFKHKAAFSQQVLEDQRVAAQAFHEPDPKNPGGVSDAELVKQGKAKTKACKAWV